jgi:hypothetical protein
VYLLGTGECANRIREAIETRADLGMDLVGWSKGTEGKSLNMHYLPRRSRIWRNDARWTGLSWRCLIGEACCRSMNYWS